MDMEGLSKMGVIEITKADFKKDFSSFPPATGLKL